MSSTSNFIIKLNVHSEHNTWWSDLFGNAGSILTAVMVVLRASFDYVAASENIFVQSFSNNIVED